MSLARRSRRRGMIMGAAIASSRANKRAAAAATEQTQPAPTTVPAAQPQAVDVEQLKKLAELRDAGIITEDEFDAKKKQILGV